MGKTPLQKEEGTAVLPVGQTSGEAESLQRFTRAILEWSL
jgi:hypothetical protein